MSMRTNIMMMMMMRKRSTWDPEGPTIMKEFDFRPSYNYSFCGKSCLLHPFVFYSKP